MTQMNATNFCREKSQNGPRMIDSVYLCLFDILEMTELFYNDRNKVICCLGLVVGRKGY